MKDVQLIHYPNGTLPPRFYEIGNFGIFGWEMEFENITPDWVKSQRELRAKCKSPLDWPWSTLTGPSPLEKYLASNASSEQKIGAYLASGWISLILDEDRDAISKILSPSLNREGIKELSRLLQDLEAGPTVLSDYGRPGENIYQCNGENEPLINMGKLAKDHPHCTEKELKELLFDSRSGRDLDLQKLIDQDLLLWQPVEYVLAHVPRAVDAPKVSKND